MIELARAGAPGRYLFFTREEVPVTESPLPALFASGLVADAELAVVLEPTDCILHAGCLGNIQARVTFTGESAHSARPWTGVNAIHELVRGLQGLVALEPLDVELDGLTYREVVSAVRVEGGIAANVVPAGERRAELPLRAGPHPRRGGAAAALARAGGELEVLSNSPSAPPALTNPLVARLRELVPDVAPKQAWTPVAQFAEQGIDAINYGPGGPATRTGKMSRCPSRTSTAPSRRCEPFSHDQPDARRDGGLSVREARGEEARARRPRRRRDRLRQGRPERADRPDDPPGAHRRAARARAVSARAGCRSCASRPPGWCGRRFGVALDPDTELDPDVRLEGGDLLARAGARRPAPTAVVAYGEPAYPVYERGALFAGAAVQTLPLRRENGFLPDLARDSTSDGARLGQLPAQPDRRRRAARVLRGAGGARGEPTSYRVRRGVHRALVRRAAAVGAAGGGPLARHRLPHAEQALVDDRLPLGFVAAPPEIVAALKSYRPTVGTAPQEFVQRASVVAWDDEGTSRRRGRATPRSATSSSPRSSARLGDRRERGDDVSLARGPRADASSSSCSSAA